MLLSATLLFLWMPTTDSPKPVATDSPIDSRSADSKKTATTNRDLPDAPAAKPETAAEPVEAIRPFSNAPVKPAFEHPIPTPCQRALWYTFMAAGHGGAAFDA